MIGTVQSKSAYFLMNIRPHTKTTLYLSRHGESQFNAEAKIGGKIIFCSSHNYNSPVPRLSFATRFDDKPLAKHYRESHPQHTGPPKLKLHIVDR